MPGRYEETVLVQKDGITLRAGPGFGRPGIVPPPVSTSPCGDVGICVAGDVDFATGEIFRPVQHVTVTGFQVVGFADSGILAYGANQTTFSNDTLIGNGQYGVTAFSSTRTTFANNRAQGSEEAGIYVGDSHPALATVSGNAVLGNAIGILVRNAEGVTIARNAASTNCAGVVVLGDAPGSAGGATITSNAVHDNSAACLSEIGPVSGLGVGLIGAHDTTLSGNTITHNVPANVHDLTGGVVVMSGFLGTPSSRNSVTGNTITGNSPDIFWDGLGLGNVFAHNVCKTSVPKGLCH